jgi:hypothetical protein
LEIDPHAIGAARLGAVELASIRGLGAVVDDIIDLDRALPRSGGVDDVEQLSSGEKASPFGRFISPTAIESWPLAGSSR